MKPAEDKHIVNARKRGKGRKSIFQIDIRQSSWKKMGTKWVNSQGFIPTDKESIKKVENWVREISSLSPIFLDTETVTETEMPNTTDILDHQLSAVEGHKKIEIIEQRRNHQEAEVEALPEEEVDEPIGVEIDKKPWAKHAKMITALLSGIAIAIILILGNNLREPRKQSLLSSSSPSDTHTLGFSQPLPLKGIGTVYLYNQNWDPSDPESEKAVKPATVRILSAYTNLRFEESRLPTKEINLRVSRIDDEKIPMLVIIPEGRDQKHNNTKLWISENGSTFLERTINKKTSWKLLKLKEDSNTYLRDLNLEFLERNKK
jgi:hypothetical protein